MVDKTNQAQQNEQEKVAFPLREREIGLVNAAHTTAVEEKTKVRDAHREAEKNKTTTTTPAVPQKKIDTYSPAVVLTELDKSKSLLVSSTPENNFKTYGKKLSEYDRANAIVKAAYSHRDVEGWALLNRGWQKWKNQNVFENRRSAPNHPLIKYEKAYNRYNELQNNPALQADPKYNNAKTDLDNAKKELIEAQAKELKQIRIDKKQAFTNISANAPKFLTEIKTPELKNLDKSQPDQVNLDQIDDILLELEQQQRTDHSVALEEITQWHVEGIYKTEDPSIIDLSKTPGHQALYDMRKKADKKAKELQDKLTVLAQILAKTSREVAGKLENKNAKPTDAEKAALESVQKHITTQINEINKTINLSKDALKNEDAAAEEYLVQKFKNDEKISAVGERFNSATQKLKENPVATVTGAGGAALGASFLASLAGYSLFGVLSVAFWPVSVAAIGFSGLWLAYRHAPPLVYDLHTDSVKDVDYGDMLKLARVGSTHALIAEGETVDENGKKTTAIVGFCDGLSTSDRETMVKNFVASFIKKGLIKPPEGMLYVTRIPSEHREEYQQLLIAECNRLKIKIGGPAMEKALDPEKAKQQQESFADTKKHTEEQDAKEQNAYTARTKSADQYELSYYHMIKVSYEKGVCKMIDVVRAIGDSMNLSEDEKKKIGTAGVNVAGGNSSATGTPLLSSNNSNNPAPAPAPDPAATPTAADSNQLSEYEEREIAKALTF